MAALGSEKAAGSFMWQRLGRPPNFRVTPVPGETGDLLAGSCPGRGSGLWAGGCEVPLTRGSEPRHLLVSGSVWLGLREHCHPRQGPEIVQLDNSVGEVFGSAHRAHLPPGNHFSMLLLRTSRSREGRSEAR